MQIPIPLIQSLSRLDHFHASDFVSAHEPGPPVVSVHLNPFKPIFHNGEWSEQIKPTPFEISKQIPWAPDAWYLSSRPSFTLDPLFHSGTYYVQEASGMFLAFVLQSIADLSKKIRILDLCAAPGGKSTLIQSLISDDSFLVSNEVIKTRVPVLYQNMTQWGRTNGVVSNNDPHHFKQMPGFFDILMIDAPCSGSGLFRKDPEAANGWSEELVRTCSQRQQRIIADAWGTLKEDGFLIYSTCSYSKEENEDILDTVLNRFPSVSVSLNPDSGWNIVECASELTGATGYRFYPDKLLGEGFFIAVIQKKQSTAGLKGERNNKPPLKISKAIESQIIPWVEIRDLSFVAVGDAIHAIHSGGLQDFETVKNTLYLKKAGVRLGKSGVSEWIPDPELALATILKEDSPNVEIDKENALQFLRGLSFEANGKKPGWQTVSYSGHKMGWIKQLDKRINNYYPKSWRIRQP